MIDYTWADWLEALATTIAENDERHLAERARAVDWQKDKDGVPLPFGAISASTALERKGHGRRLPVSTEGMPST